MNNAIGILGGTFDPVHYGHLRLAIEAADRLDLSKIHLIPNAVPPHRPQPLATAEQRLAMLQLAVVDNDRFKLDTRELEREGTSYTVDTLLSLRREFAGTALYLLMGTDAFLHIQSWHRWQELLSLAHIVIMQRPGQRPAMAEPLASWYNKHMVKTRTQNLQGNILSIPVTQLDISASNIRQMIIKDHNPQYLLPKSVIQFIERQKLYRQP